MGAILREKFVNESSYYFKFKYISDFISIMYLR